MWHICPWGLAWWGDAWTLTRPPLLSRGRGTCAGVELLYLLDTNIICKTLIRISQQYVVPKFMVESIIISIESTFSREDYIIGTEKYWNGYTPT